MTIDELEHQRAARLDPEDLPLSMTRAEAAAYSAATALLDQRIASCKGALATLDKLGTDDADVAWLAFLTSARETLATELLTIKSPIRDPKVMGRNINLTRSIRTIDFGLGVLAESGHDLTTLRLGELMQSAGYEAVGADPTRNYLGVMPWFGSVSEVEQRIAARERRCAAAQAQLDEALLDDDVRAKRDAEADMRRAELNTRPVRKVRGDGSMYDRFPDGTRVDVTT